MDFIILNNSYIVMPTRTKLSSINNYPNHPPQAAPFVYPTSHHWSHCTSNWNKFMHTLSGNRRLGYRIAMWNCRKGLLKQDNSASEKVTDIKSLLQKHDLHLLGVVETDLHGVGSRVRRSKPVTK